MENNLQTPVEQKQVCSTGIDTAYQAASQTIKVSMTVTFIYQQQ